MSEGNESMQVAAITDPPGVAVEPRERPTPGEGEAVVAVERAGICGSDFPMWTGDRDVPEGHVPGHEFAGRVVETGPKVPDVATEGTPVTARIASGCGTCPYCRRGQVRLCTDIRELGVTYDGAFAEYALVDAETLHRIPEGMDYAEAASVDPAASAHRGVRQLEIDAGDSVVVVGPGPIGLYGVQLALAEGASPVVMLGTRESRNSVARDLGADATINVREEDVDARLAEEVGPEGADAVLEATGNAAAIPSAIDAARKGGAVSLVGLAHQPVESLEFWSFVRSEKTVQGAFLYTYDEFQTCLDLFDDGTLTTEGVLTHTLPLSEVDRGFRLVDDREAIKVHLEP
jgi:2-desacetyl-2-hydroxyethyl bacteriochlorophyllide A dehydrogenase